MSTADQPSARRTGRQGPGRTRTASSELATAGLVGREVEDGPPIAVHYRLTTAGEALRPAIHELTIWAQTCLPQTRALQPDAH